jgi:hypothetical protein
MKEMAKRASKHIMKLRKTIDKRERGSWSLKYAHPILGV